MKIYGVDKTGKLYKLNGMRENWRETLSACGNSGEATSSNQPIVSLFFVYLFARFVKLWNYCLCNCLEGSARRRFGGEQLFLVGTEMGETKAKEMVEITLSPFLANMFMNRCEVETKKWYLT